jgi:hypothetical protein
MAGFRYLTQQSPKSMGATINSTADRLLLAPVSGRRFFYDFSGPGTRIIAQAVARLVNGSVK